MAALPPLTRGFPFWACFLYLCRNLLASGFSENSNSESQNPRPISQNRRDKDGATCAKWSWLRMEKQRPEIIRDNKKRGEWTKAVSAARGEVRNPPSAKIREKWGTQL